MDSLPAPLNPCDCDLKDFPATMIYRHRLRDSAFNAKASDAAPALEVLRDPACIYRYGLFYVSSSGSGADLASEAKFGLDWLLHMWDGKKKVLYYQVGIGNGGLGYSSDHDV